VYKLATVKPLEWEPQGGYSGISVTGRCEDFFGVSNFLVDFFRYKDFGKDFFGGSIKMISYRSRFYAEKNGLLSYVLGRLTFLGSCFCVMDFLGV